MRAPAARLLAPLVTLLVVAGCSGRSAGRSEAPGQSAGSGSGSAQPTPALGGPPVVRVTPPAHAMDRLERPVAARLERQVAREGLTLEYLDCPRWDGAVPSRMACHGYVDGLRTGVDVTLTEAVAGRAVGFDARLSDGLIATRNLEHTLDRLDLSAADCGRLPAYAARVGSEIVCRVTRRGEPHYVVATVRDRAGAVTISDYRGTSATP